MNIHPRFRRRLAELQTYGFTVHEKADRVQLDVLPESVYADRPLVTMLNANSANLLYWGGWPGGSIVSPKNVFTRSYVEITLLMAHLRDVEEFISQHGLTRNQVGAFLAYYVLGSAGSDVQNGFPGYDANEICELVNLKHINPESIVNLLEHHLPMRDIRNYDPEISMSIYLGLYPSENQIQLGWSHTVELN